MNGVGATSPSSDAPIDTEERRDNAPILGTSRLSVLDQYGTAPLTRQAAKDRIEEYASTKRGDRPADIVAVEALIELSNKIDPTIMFNLFCEQILNIDKSVIGTEQDPTSEMFQIIVKLAQEYFWSAASTEDNREPLESITKRCRNWISLLMRKNNVKKVLPALHFLLKLPLTDELVKRAGLSATLKTLQSIPAPDEILQSAKKLEDKYSKAFNSENKPISIAPSNQKLFGDGGALKLRTHKRIREHNESSQPNSPPQNTNLDTQEELNTDKEPSRKRMKSVKKVHWKPDQELVQVRFFEMDGIAKFKSAKNARLQEHDEGSAMHPNIVWIPPRRIEFESAFGNDQLRPLMSTRRGGLKQPVSPESEIQKSRESKVSRSSFELPDSPEEPPSDQTGPEPSWKPKDGGKFTPVNAPSGWLQKQNPIVAPNMAHVMNPMMPQMMPQMMPSFPWSMSYPMNMSMSQAQMNEFMRMNGNVFGSSTKQ